MDIIRLGGTERRLYELVAPLVMDAAVIRQNNGYPFKTSGGYEWYVACQNGVVKGFMPLKGGHGRMLIDNYYAEDDDPSVLSALIAAAVEGRGGTVRLDATVLKRHAGVFRECGFVTVAMLKNYEKMTYSTEGKGCGDDT